MVVKKYGICEIVIVGGVFVNLGLCVWLKFEGEKEGWNIYILKFEYCMDNVVMIVIVGYYFYEVGIFVDQLVSVFV